ncbi:MAG TPA: glycosyltransferase family 4 protein [Actinomycetota bacterium]|nr:glycosyltransferase family 4 protein [Actinomycetota bacterium]
MTVRLDPRLRRIAGRVARRLGLRPPLPQRVRHNGRLAFVGPMPPAATGIASYDRSVLDGLRRIGFLEGHATDVLWPTRESHLRGIGAYELGIYQLGNNAEFHRWIYGMAIASPGLTVIHDLAMDGLVWGLQAANDPLGAEAAREALGQRRPVTDPDAAMHEPLRVVWCAAVARASRGIVVHSAFCKRYLEDAGVRTPIFTVPHPVVEDEGSMRRAETRARELRAPLEARGARTIVVAPGDVNDAKCLPSVLDAVATLPREVHLGVVGRRMPSLDLDAAIADRGVGDRVTVRYDVPDDDFRAWLVAADVGVDLRFPHRGEVSGSLAMAMVAGIPTIVSATGTYLDLPDDAVVGIAPGPADPPELAARIRELHDDPARRARIGDAARAHMAALRDSDATAHGYEEAILATRELVMDPTRAVRALWAACLVDIGIDEALAEQGYGVSYVRALESFVRTP